MRHGEFERIFAAARAQGWTVTHTRSSHVMLTHPGRPRIYVASTPSDRRAWLNVRALLRREGVSL